MALIKSTDLDFDTIKDSLKTYFESQSEFADYNFEAAGLSNILDVLAYNTHINGLIANVGLNESFLASAQLRSSVISQAETLGYYARSRVGSFATVNLSITGTGNTTVTTLTLPPYTSFTASVDDVSYTFQTLEVVSATNDGSGNFTFKTSTGSENITITEGRLKTKTFYVGDASDEQVYVIPDQTIDVSTLDIKAYDTASSASYTEYQNINNVVRINSNSTVYIIREVPNGYYELTFSEGNVLGKSPEANNKIVATYLSTKGPLANGATTFSADNQVTVGSSDYNLTITTVANSAGGDDKESITSIKANAPIAFATQQRLVTAEDYKALILENYSSTIQDVVSWGGNDNVPPEFGVVFVSLKFKTGIADSVKTTIKNSIVSQLSNNLAIMSIDTKFTDPVDTYLEIKTTFNLDPNLTGDTTNTIQTNVQTLINNYFANNLGKFDAVFRRSTLLGEIDDLTPAILNSKMDIKVQQRWTPTLNVQENITLDFPVFLAEPDDTIHTIQSTTFKDENGKTVYIQNVLDSTKLELIDNSNGLVEKDNVGEYVPGTGEVKLVGLEVSSYIGDAIKIGAYPANQSTIRPLRNYILNLDTERSASTAVLDFQNTPTALST